MRRPRVMSFDDYLFHRCESIHRLGGDVDIAMHSAVGAADTVIVEARVGFPDELELRVFEVVERTDEGAAHRFRYSYQVRWRRQLVVRYERDPVGHPEMPEHKHPASGGRIPWAAVRLATVVDEMWEEYRLRIEAPPVTGTESPRAADEPRRRTGA